jgi:hypothetical protein
MKLKRERRLELEPEQASLLVSLYLAFDQGYGSCARLIEHREAGEPALAGERAEALKAARTIAYVSRVTWESMVNLQLLERISDDRLSPLGALTVLARLAFALTAMAEDDPEPEALLSSAELENLVANHGIEDWLTYYREAIARMEAGTR